MFIYHDKRRLGAAAFCGAFTLASGTLLAADPVKIQAAEAYIDTDPGQGNGSALTLTSLSDEMVIEIGVNNALTKPTIPGTHVLAMRFQDDTGQWSDPIEIGFPVYSTAAASSNNVKAMEAYLDSDPGQGSGTAFSGIGDDSLVEKPPVVTFTKTGLGAGTHVISVRAQDSQNQWSDPVKIAFPVYQPSTTPPNQIAAMEGFIGYPPPSAGNGTGFTGAFDAVVDEKTGYVSMLSLPQGSYPYGARVRDTAGEWSSVVTMVFDYIDSDGDGIPDAYEDANGMDKNDPSDANSDGDGDKFSNLDEWLFDTDPDKFFDKPTGDPGCSSGADDVVLPNSFAPGKHLCIGNTSISTSGATTVEDGAYLYLRAPAIDLKPQLRVEDGGRMRTRTSDLVP